MAKKRRRREEEHETLWEVVVAANRDSPLIRFGLEQLRDAWLARGRTVHLEIGPDVGQIDADIRLAVEPVADLQPEGFAFHPRHASLDIRAADQRAAMYALLALAEHVQMGLRLDQIPPQRHAPALTLRAAKVHIPLEPYPSGGYMQANLETFWSLQFWRDFLDTLASHRFNALVLCSRNPFPWMFRLQRWPAAHAIPDQQLEQAERFWRDLFQHCLARGLDPYILICNMRISDDLARALDLPHAWPAPPTDAASPAERPTTELVKQYLAECLRSLLTTYPQVRGLGLVAGPAMPGDPAHRHQWLTEACLAGIASAARRPALLYRIEPSKQLAPILHRLVEAYQGPLLVSFHWPRLLSHPQALLLYHDRVLQSLANSDLPLVCDLGQDDVHCLPWAQPEFVRQAVQAMTGRNLAGLTFGSDGYVWMRDFISRGPDVPWQWDFQKHQDQFFLWGRTAYDPHLPDERLVGFHKHRFGDEFAQRTALALQTASQIIPAVNRQIWMEHDFQWHPETCLSQHGLRTILDFVFSRSMPGSNTISIDQYAQAILTGQHPPDQNPLATVELLHESANATLAIVAELETPARTRPALWWLIRDLEAIACLGHYYGFKIAGALELAAFRRSRSAPRRTRALQLLAAAGGWWQRLADNTEPRYKTFKMGRLMLPFGWWLYRQDVQRDQLLAEQFDPQCDYRPPMHWRGG